MLFHVKNMSIFDTTTLSTGTTQPREKAKGERLAHSDSLSTSTVNWMKWVGWEGPRKIMNVTPFTKYVFKVWFRWERGSRVQGNCILYMITWVWLHLLRMFLHTLHFLTLCYFYQQNSFRVFFTSTISYIISYIAVFCWTLSLVWSYFSHQTVLTGGREFVFLPCVFRRTLSPLCGYSHL